MGNSSISQWTRSITAWAGGGPSPTRGKCILVGSTKAGFSLLELLLVLVILAVVAAISAPALLRSGSVVELKAVVRSLAAGMRYTRGQAIAQHRELQLHFDLEQRKVTYPAGGRVQQLPAFIALKLFTARRELDSESSGSIRFFPDGSSTGGRVTLSTETASYLVDVDWFTGRIRVLDAGDDSATPVGGRS